MVVRAQRDGADVILQLHLKGLGVIDEADLELGPGLTVITGETGAGKTMVLSSLRLLLGEKGDQDLLRAGHKQLEVDAVFALPDTLAETLEDIGLETDEDLYISRTVPLGGRSRAVAQGRPVPLSTLSSLVGPLVTIHGQADQWKVRRRAVQRQILDGYAPAAHRKQLEAYRSSYRELEGLRQKLTELLADEGQRDIEVKYLLDTADAIAELGLEPGEEERLDAQIDRYAHVAELHLLVQEARAAVAGAEAGDLLEAAGDAVRSLQRASSLDAALLPALDRLRRVEVELTDIAGELRDYLGELRDDPEELDRLQQRRADLESLLRGRATDTAGLLAWEKDARSRVEELTGDGADPDLLAKAVARAEADLAQQAAGLSAGRTEAGGQLAHAVNGELRDLAMSGAEFRVRVRPAEPHLEGADEIQMELKARADGPFVPLGEGASGGELSRVMLALEVSQGSRRRPSTYVFDEVDQGIGGRTAGEVGRRLARLGAHQQVIAVTHLPQVAAWADQHVVLRRDGERTIVEEITGENRIKEIARMLGGESDSITAQRHAAELLQRGAWQNREE